MNAAASYLRWIGYIVTIIAIGVYVFIVTMPCPSCGTWDLVILPIALVVVPILSLILAIKWPIIAGEALIAAGVLMGWDIFTNNIWVAMLYTVPFLFAGLAFLIAGVFLLITEPSSS